MYFYKAEVNTLNSVPDTCGNTASSVPLAKENSLNSVPDTCGVEQSVYWGVNISQFRSGYLGRLI